MMMIMISKSLNWITKVKFGCNENINHWNVWRKIMMIFNLTASSSSSFSFKLRYLAPPVKNSVKNHYLAWWIARWWYGWQLQAHACKFINRRLMNKHLCTSNSKWLTSAESLKLTVHGWQTQRLVWFRTSQRPATCYLFIGYHLTISIWRLKLIYKRHQPSSSSFPSKHFGGSHLPGQYYVSGPSCTRTSRIYLNKHGVELLAGHNSFSACLDQPVADWFVCSMTTRAADMRQTFFCRHLMWFQLIARWRTQLRAIIWCYLTTAKAPDDWDLSGCKLAGII